MAIDTSTAPERVYRANWLLRFGLPFLAVAGLAGFFFGFFRLA